MDNVLSTKDREFFTHPGITKVLVTAASSQEKINRILRHDDAGVRMFVERYDRASVCNNVGLYTNAKFFHNVGCIVGEFGEFIIKLVDNSLH